MGAVFSSFEPRIVDMRTGKFTDAIDIASFDERAAAKDPSMSSELQEDPASIGRKPNFTTVYLLKNKDGSLDKIILPIYGYGLWSTLYGFIALEEMEMIYLASNFMIMPRHLGWVPKSTILDGKPNGKGKNCETRRVT